LGISQRLHQEVGKIVLEESQISMSIDVFDKIVEEVEWSMVDHLRRFNQKVCEVKKENSFHSSCELEENDIIQDFV
jgi:hypothetical protein